ncbi:MAG: site-2 protease family protein, partial [Candidatus Woesearchaeota archaeon]
MRGSTKLFRIFGIDIKIHFSWWFVFALLSWSLSSAFFPHFYPDLGTREYWVMGIASALLLFVSVLLHELSHSLVAKSKKIKVESITLFFFGGVAGITDEEMKPMDELQMALAGPIFSLALAGIFFLIFRYNGNVLFTGIMFYLYQLNLILAIFNLVPGYPLDGGRALRAILHAYYKDLKKATRIAAKGGKFFAGFLIFMGIFSLVTGTANGLWFILLGGFLWFIAGMSYEQVVVKDGLSKVSLKEVSDKNYPKLDPELSFAEAVKKAYPHQQDSFIVQKGTVFLGIMDFKRITKMSAEMQ